MQEIEGKADLTEWGRWSSNPNQKSLEKGKKMLKDVSFPANEEENSMDLAREVWKIVEHDSDSFTDHYRSTWHSSNASNKEIRKFKKIREIIETIPMAVLSISWKVN